MDRASRYVARLKSLLALPAGDPDARLRSDLVLGFGLFELLVTALAAALEFALGTPLLGALLLAGAVAMVATLAWLLRGASPDRVAPVMVGLLVGLLALTNGLTGGRAIGANIALPTVAMFAVLVSTPRAGAAWIVLIIVQLVAVAFLRQSTLTFPVQPDPRWVVTAIDRVPLYFTFGSALIGVLLLRALEQYRLRLDRAGAAEAHAHAAAGNALARVAQSAERFTDFAEIAADGFWETDADLHITYVSPSFAQAIGLYPEQMLGRTPDAAYFLRFPDAAGVTEYMGPLRERRAFQDQLLVTLDGAGRTRWLLNQGRPRFDHAGGFAGFRGAVRDVTEQRRVERALRHSEARQRLIADNLPVAIAHVDTQGRFTFNNRTHARWLGRSLDQVTGQHVEDVHGPEVLEQIRPHLEQAYLGHRTTFDFPGGGRLYRATYIPETTAAGAVVGVFGLIHDITKIKQVECELRTLAQFDPLTGLANRRRYEERLAEAIARSERSGQPMGLMFLDLDYFKAVNDRLGHRTGDEVLKEFARRLDTCTRNTDTPARLAGDEFVVVLEGLSCHADAESAATKFLEVLRLPFQVDGQTLAVSASIGLALRRQGDMDGGALLRRADAALYAAKAGQRGTFHAADEVGA